MAGARRSASDLSINESDLIFKEFIARGGSGDVYRAIWKSPENGDMEVAAKKIPLDPYIDITKDIYSEIDYFKEFDHVNVIKYYGHIVTRDHITIVTEFAEKGSLHNYLKTRSRLPSSLIQKWALEAARALAYLRNRRVIHRDVKSHNFLITADNTLKICDFGLAKHLPVTKMTTKQSGTTRWLAPEVFDNVLSPKADVFAYGTVLWELITCESPFENRPEHWVIFNVVARGLRPTIPPDCPPGYKALMEMCWQEERQSRPDITEVVDCLENADESFAFDQKKPASLQGLAVAKRKRELRVGNLINVTNTEVPRMPRIPRSVRSDSDTRITDKDISDVIEILRPRELFHLYIELGITPFEVADWECGAPTRLKTMNVLKQWRQKHGSKANQEMLLDALGRCWFLDAKRELESKWELTGSGPSGYPIASDATKKKNTVSWAPESYGGWKAFCLILAHQILRTDSKYRFRGIASSCRGKGQGSFSDVPQADPISGKTRRQLILALIALLSFFQYGSLAAIYINIPNLIEHLEMTATEAGLTCSIAYTIPIVLGPIWSACANATSHRFAIVFGGFLMSFGLIMVSFVSSRTGLVHFCTVLLAIGRGLPMVSQIVVVRTHFDDNTFNRALGIASAGGSLGFFLVPPLVESLNDYYGWRGGLLIFGALSFHSAFAGLLMKGRFGCGFGSANKVNKRSRTSCPNIDEVLGFATLKRHPSFVIELVAFLLLDLALYGWLQFIFTFIIHKGVDYLTASLLVALGGLGSLLGRLLFGFVLDAMFSPRKLLVTSALIASVTLVLYPFDIFGLSNWWWGSLTFLTGIFAWSITPVYAALIKETFPNNISDYSKAIGLHYTMRGIGALTGGVLTGYIFDASGAFDLAFVVLAGFKFFGGALICLEVIFKKRKHCDEPSMFGTLEMEMETAASIGEVKIVI